LSNNNPEPFKLSPEERKRLVSNLYGIQLQFERLVQLKMDATILNQSEISPELKNTYEKWVKLLNQVVDSEIEVTLRTALSAIKPEITKPKRTFGEIMKSTEYVNEFTTICNYHNLLLRSQAETEIIQIENGESLSHRLPTFQPISEYAVNIVAKPYHDYDFSIVNSNGETLISFGTYSDVRSQIRTWSIRCKRCGLGTSPVSSYYGNFRKPFEAALPIKCYNCKRYLLVEAKPKIRQQLSHMIPPSISNFFQTQMGLVI
jgi:hypothetical protein